MTGILPGYWYYWGKTTSDGWHPLVCHMLDVAAVGRSYLDFNPLVKELLIKKTNLESELFLDLFGYFLTLHDIGKFSPEFQLKNEQVLKELEREYKNIPTKGHHTNLGMVIWNQMVANRFFSPQENTKFKRNSNNNLQNIKYWAASSIGHHGVPVELNVEHESLTFEEAIPDVVKSDVELFLDDVKIIFPETEHIKKNQKSDLINKLIPLSYWFSGITILSDWLASSKEFFPMSQQFNGHSKNSFTFSNLTSYYSEALEKARKTLPKTGLISASPAKSITFFSLFPDLAAKKAKPTPMQRLAEELELPSGGKLVILEDVTGAGKTEAAWILAGRIIASGDADGIYMGLPTMATSNGMYPRLAKIYERFYNNEKPSLILSHSARKMHDDFQKSILDLSPLNEIDLNSDDLRPAGAYCNSWLSDMSKKSLLAQVGVGTIDQALLSVLRTSHNTLRLFGLMRKVLIVDEVHAYDSYTGGLLVNLIRFHCHIGGSIILLSATLPERIRHEFIKAFGEGTGQAITLDPKGEHEDYPLLTLAANFSSSNQLITESDKELRTGKPETRKVQSRKEISRKVKTHFIYNINDVFQFIQKSARSGKAVVWIRNTVKDAMDAFDVLSNVSGKLSATPMLFHSRFALQDRLEIEDHVLDIFGKDGDPDKRKGKVLVATQVVEQSLDLDFDEMVTDLCPVDLVLQRGGRLRRHIRDKDGKLKEAGKDERGEVILNIYAPEPDHEITENWYANYFPGAAYVYNNHVHLWKTARILRDANGYTMPDDARKLIEKVYGDSGPEAPDILYKSAENYRVLESEKDFLSIRNVFDLEIGFIKDRNMQPWPEEKAPTRFGDDSLNIRLAIYDNGELKPYAGKGRHAWQRSELRVPASSFRGMSYDKEIESLVEKTQTSLPDKGKYGRLLPLIVEGYTDKNTIYRGLINLKNNQVLRYSALSGLHMT